MTIVKPHNDLKPGNKCWNWTIIECLDEIKKNDGGKSCLVECSCENKTRKIIRVRDIINGKPKTCKACNPRFEKQFKISQKYPEVSTGTNGIKRFLATEIILGIIGNAKQRNLVFELDYLEAFEKYCLGSCFYCGFKPIWPETHNGIDRYDNDKGYVEDNCVSCCFRCNWAKRNNVVDEFKFRVNKIYKYLILNKKEEWLENNINIKIGTIEELTHFNFGRRGTELSKKYPESYGLTNGSYAMKIWHEVKSICNKAIKSKNIKFNLIQLKAFENYIIGTCFYCGLKPQFPHTRNGIDRVDSSKGYTEDNCVSCCKFCNYAKNDYTLEIFKDWVIRIYTHLNTFGWNFEI